MKKTLGTMISELRKQHGMTQLELAEKMGVTDKAVSKWERSFMPRHQLYSESRRDSWRVRRRTDAGQERGRSACQQGG
jgi:transcriptional regulator with XRE-family HTH domain